jgi:hypothetical protein
MDDQGSFPGKDRNNSFRYRVHTDVSAPSASFGKGKVALLAATMRLEPKTYISLPISKLNIHGAMLSTSTEPYCLTKKTEENCKNK